MQPAGGRLLSCIGGDLSAGIGLVFEKPQVDFALDLSDPADTAAVSAIYSF